MVDISEGSCKLNYDFVDSPFCITYSIYTYIMLLSHLKTENIRTTNPIKTIAVQFNCKSPIYCCVENNINIFILPIDSISVSVYLYFFRFLQSRKNIQSRILLCSMMVLCKPSALLHPKNCSKFLKICVICVNMVVKSIDP